MPPDITPPFAEEFDIRADIPGVSKGDIHLMVDNDVLSISVACKAAKQVNGWPLIQCRHLTQEVMLSHLGRSVPHYLCIFITSHQLLTALLLRSTTDRCQL